MSGPPPVRLQPRALAQLVWLPRLAGRWPAMSPNIRATQPSWSKNPSSRGGRALGQRGGNARFGPVDVRGLRVRYWPDRLDESALPGCRLHAGGHTGEKPPGWVTASTTGPPSRCSTACRNPAGPRATPDASRRRAAASPRQHRPSRTGRRSFCSSDHDSQRPAGSQTSSLTQTPQQGCLT